MTEEIIIKHLSFWLDNRKFPFKIPRAFMYGWECDFWCTTCEGETREFEIKISRADYAIDRKKDKHNDLTKGANYFYYVCPTNLIAKEEVFGRYGLIYVSETGSMTVVKKPQRLNDFKFKDWKMLANKMYWKWYSLWIAKYKGDFTVESLAEYREGFNIDLSEFNS